MIFLNWPPLLIVALGLCVTSVDGEVPVNKPIRVLIVDGFGNHDWKHTTLCLRAILEPDPQFAVSVSTFPAGSDPQEIDAWNPQFDAYDVVIQTCNDLGGGPRWPRRVESNLETYVKNGGGLFVFHSANNAFRDWEEYNRMIGLGWRDKDFGEAITINPDGTEIRVPAGAGENTNHGPRRNAEITRIGDHPIHVGMPRQWIAANLEVYRYARGPAKNLTVLSYAQDIQTGLNFPVEWIVAYGNGRVYNSVFGHVWKNEPVPQGICCAGFQTLLQRTILWLAGKGISPDLPADFPTDTHASLRPYPVTKQP